MQHLRKNQVGEDIEFKNTMYRTQKICIENGKTIDVDELDQILGAAKRKKKKLAITRIYVVNGDKRATYTNTDKFLEYYEGRVKDTEKFHNFFHVYVTYAIDK